MTSKWSHVLHRNAELRQRPRRQRFEWTQSNHQVQFSSIRHKYWRDCLSTREAALAEKIQQASELHSPISLQKSQTQVILH